MQPLFGESTVQGGPIFLGGPLRHPRARWPEAANSQTALLSPAEGLPFAAAALLLLRLVVLMLALLRLLVLVLLLAAAACWRPSGLVSLLPVS